MSSSMTCLDMSVWSQAPSLEEMARNDHKFLAFDAQEYVHQLSLEEAGVVFENATNFLHYLEQVRADPVVSHETAIRHGFSDSLDFDKYLANIDHVMRSIQQATLDFLIQNSIEALEPDTKRRNKWFEEIQNKSGEWFSEWSSDRPPLSSTMPWNIKASLVVLWGVCWMFYISNESVNSSRQTPEDSWYATTTNADWVSLPTVADPTQAIAYPNTMDATQVQHHDREPSLLSHSSALRGRSPSVRLSHADASELDMIGQVGPRYASQENMSQHPSPMTSHLSLQNNAYPGQLYQQQATSRLDPLDKPSLASTVGTRSPRTSSTISPQPGTSDIGGYPSVTPTSVWSPNSTTHATYSNNNISHEPWSQQPNFQHTSSARNSYPSSSIEDTYPFTATTIPSHGWGLIPGYTQGMSIETSPQPPSHRPVYPASSHSGISDQDYPRPQAMSMSRQNSPRVPSDQFPRRPRDRAGSGIGSDISDVARDERGNMICDHPKCSKNPPIFARKCELKKHMDTHTRPYICRVAGCEKVQGFTYSGGLLRHEREVHGQHGGPKLPRFCPHKDCKRSTGQGFSRKENLNEHLRRVHRGIGLGEGTLKSEPAGSPSTSNLILPSQRHVSDSSVGRKRRRDTEDEESDQPSPPFPAMKDLMQKVVELTNEVKKLKQDITVKDATISQLRRTLDLQSGGH